MFFRRTKKIKDKNSISRLMKIKIGGVNQWVLIRGNNLNNPVILFLHGGPGTAQIGFIRKFQVDLEKDFTIIQWDQRGAGLSFNRRIPKESMTIKNLVQDTIELTKFLLKYLKKEKIYLVGHSFGSILGLYVIKKEPDLFYRYFSIAQVTNMYDIEEKSYGLLLEKSFDSKHYYKLKKIGLAPFKKFKQQRIYQKYINFYRGGISYDGKLLKKILFNIFFSTEYKFIDGFRCIRGQFFNMKNFEDEINQINLIEEIDKVKIPITFISGKHDLIVPYEISKKYFEIISSPSKEFYLFKNSAHSPIWEELERFIQIIKSKIKIDI